MVKDREAWYVAVHGVAKGWTQLSDWIATIPFTKILYIDLPPGYLFGAFSRAIWGAVSQAAVPTLLQIKLNLQLSHCASYFSLHGHTWVSLSQDLRRAAGLGMGGATPVWLQQTATHSYSRLMLGDAAFVPGKFNHSLACPDVAGRGMAWELDMGMALV